MARVRELARGLPLPPWGRIKPDTLAPGVYLTRNVRLAHALSPHVWVAEHLTLGTSVVVKFLPSALSANGMAAPEPSSPPSIRDPHIVQVTDQGVTRAGTRFVVMEMIGGESLRTRLARTGPLSLREVRTIIAQTSGALGKAHASGVAHGEVAPDNLFLMDAAGEPFIKILGFVERADESQPQRDSLLALAGYASPEQLTHKGPPDAHADLWALAVSAYELLTGVGPFTASTPEGIAMAVCQGPLRPITRVRPDLPHAMDAWFARALSKDRLHRYRTASEFAQSFAEAAEGHYFVDPDRGNAALDDEEEQEEPTALWSQPAWWSDAAAAATRSPSSLASPMSSYQPAFSTNRAARTVAFRALPASSMPVTAPVPVDEDDERPLLVPLAAIIVGAAIGLTGALLVWGVQFWPTKARIEQSEATRAASGSEDTVESTALEPNALEADEVKTRDLTSTDVAHAAGSSPRPVIEAHVRSLSTLPTAPPDPEEVATAPAAAVAPPAAVAPIAVVKGASSKPRAQGATSQRQGHRTPGKKAAPLSKDNCDPPYYFDSQHIKRVKFQCL
jgi:eukaryotic-like serine/threonine-protein kinase